MLYFVKTDQIVLEDNKRIKYFVHLGWGVPFLILQYLKWKLTGEHIYNFLREFSWSQLIVFEMSLYFLSVVIDSTLSLRHGFKLTMKVIGNKDKLLELDRKKQD